MSAGSEMWDRRYASEKLAYGSQANAFLASQLSRLTPGKLLLPGEGEGRNAMYAARSGWKVEAFDQSKVARDKAMAWLASEDLGMSYTTCGVEDFAFEKEVYDAVALVFFHAPGPVLAHLYKGIQLSLKPGGSLIVQAFSKKQLGRNSGGPQVAELLFEKSDLALAFEGFDTLILEEKETELDEGPFHQGLASVINYVGLKT